MSAVARLADLISHGGKIIEASTTTYADGRGIARVGDRVACNIHGVNPIVTGSNIVRVDERKEARVGDRTACGASIVSGSPVVFDD